MIMSGPYDQNFIRVIYLNLVMYIRYIFPVKKVAITSTLSRPA